MHCSLCIRIFSLFYSVRMIKYNMLYLICRYAMYIKYKRDIKFGVCDCIGGNPKHLCPLQIFSALAKTFIFLCSCLCDSSGDVDLKIYFSIFCDLYKWTWACASRVFRVKMWCVRCVLSKYLQGKEIDVKSVGHKPEHTWLKNGSYKSSWRIMTKDGAR